MHQLATTITLLIIAERQQLKLHADDHRFEYDIYNVIDRLTDLSGWADERKADLYARIAESVTADMRMQDMEVRVNRALQLNAVQFGA